MGTKCYGPGKAWQVGLSEAKGKYILFLDSDDDLKAEMEAIQKQMVEAKKNERANSLKEVKRLCKEFGFTAGMLKGSLAEGRKKQW